MKRRLVPTTIPDSQSANFKRAPQSLRFNRGEKVATVDLFRLQLDTVRESTVLICTNPWV